MIRAEKAKRIMQLYEDDYDNFLDKLKAKRKAKKEAGMGAIFGFVCLGIVVTVIGVVLFKSDKKSQQVIQPFRAAA